MNAQIKIPKEQALKNLRTEIAAGRPIIAAGAGVGLIGRIVDRAGIDLVVVYNSGYYRMNGYSSILGNLPVGDANQIVVELGEKSILNAVHRAPVVAGIYGIDPTRDMEKLLARLAEIGYSGVINYPTVGKIGGTMRQELESVGLGLAREIETMKLASRMGFLTMAYVFNPEEAALFAKAGLDILVAHVGLTQGGDVGAATKIGLSEAIRNSNLILKAGLKARRNVIPLCHGGSISTPEDAQKALAETVAVGFVGASSIERLPVEQAVSRVVEDFKKIPIPA